MNKGYVIKDGSAVYWISISRINLMRFVCFQFLESISTWGIKYLTTVTRQNYNSIDDKNLETKERKKCKEE